MSLQERGDSRHVTDDEWSDFWPEVSRWAVLECDLSLVSANSSQRVFFEFGLIIAVMLALALAANLLIPGP